MWINSVWVGPVGLNRKLKWASKSINYMDSFINMNWTIPFRERENVLSRTGRKGLFTPPIRSCQVRYTLRPQYTLSHRIVAQTKTKSPYTFCSEEALTWRKRSPVPTPPFLWVWPTELLPVAGAAAALIWAAAHAPNTAVCSDFPFIVWLVISPIFRFRKFDGFGLFFGYQSFHIGIGFVDLYGFCFFFFFFPLYCLIS